MDDKEVVLVNLTGCRIPQDLVDTMFSRYTPLKHTIVVPKGDYATLLGTILTVPEHGGELQLRSNMLLNLFLEQMQKFKEELCVPAINSNHPLYEQFKEKLHVCLGEHYPVAVFDIQIVNLPNLPGDLG